MTASGAVATNRQDALPVSREAVLAQYADMIASVPIAEDDDGSGIIADVLMATDLDGLNGGEGLPEAEDMIKYGQIKIVSIARRDSTLADSRSPWYLIVDAEDSRGNPLRFSTSSATIMAQLVKCYVQGWLPIVGTVQKSAKATKAGYYPLSLVVQAKSG